MTHITYNISNILSAYSKHCNVDDESYAWLQSRIDDLISDYKNRLAVQIPPVCSKRDLLGNIAGLFGSANSLTKTYKISKQFKFSTWLTDQMTAGFQHITNSNDNLIKAIRSEAQALLMISHTLFNQTRTIERDLACRTFAQYLFATTRQEILDLRLHKTPRHVLSDLIEILDLDRMPIDAEVSPWWDDTFYERGTRTLVDTMNLVERTISETEYHLFQAQVETNLARKTATILSSSSTRSALNAYTWWDWILRSCSSVSDKEGLTPLDIETFALGPEGKAPDYNNAKEMRDATHLQDGNMSELKRRRLSDGQSDHVVDVTERSQENSPQLRTIFSHRITPGAVTGESLTKNEQLLILYYPGAIVLRLLQQPGVVTKVKEWEGIIHNEAGVSIAEKKHKTTASQIAEVQLVICGDALREFEMSVKKLPEAKSGGAAVMAHTRVTGKALQNENSWRCISGF
nr:uncharacterized protein LOC110439400 [Danio rerio]|eukprot:XP_021331055.1 uncharacterized protein LOC110439400 [Danio rerio]